MATGAVKTPVLRVVAKRSFSSQKYVPISGTVSEIKTTVLPNKLVVASAENGSPIARLSVVFKAGSRYESFDNLGVTHALRIAAGLSTKNTTQFAITRNIQQVGASLTCTTDRETVAYTLTGTYEGVQHGSEFLSEIASNQVFKPWEVSDSAPRMKLELKSLAPEAKAINFLHKAAFRSGLGNSLFCTKHKVGKISSETLQHYVSSNFTTNRAAVIGLGIDHNTLLAYAQNIHLESGAGSATQASKYFGGEIRSEKGGDLAYVAVGAEGAAITNHKDALAFCVLQRALGVGPYAKRGNESSGLLYKAISGSVGENPFIASAINAAYSDSGLFGFLCVAPSDAAKDVVLKAASVLKSGNVSDADVARAKKQLKTATLLALESGEQLVEELGTQAILLGSLHTPNQIAAAIDGVSVGDVKKVAQQVAKSNLSLAAVGNLKTVPFLDELK